jgi:nucleoside-diphosphate-sugar epimerase
MVKVSPQDRDGPQPGSLGAGIAGATLITGASGFVGSNLMTVMQGRGLATRGVTSGASPGLTSIGSWTDQIDWRDKLEGIDTIVHLAARVHVMQEMSADPLAEFRKANVWASLNLAKQAADAGVRRFVFVSSIKVNGERTEPGRPFRADDIPSPQDPYAISKTEAEQALVALGRQTGLEIVIVRPPLIYGRGVKGNFASLITWAASGLPSVFAGFENRRSFVFLETLCDFLITVLDHPAAANETFLVSDGHDLSTHELYSTLARASGRRSIAIPVPPMLIRAAGRLAGRSAHVDRLLDNLQIDIRKTHETLGWRPAITPAEALSKLFRV